MSEAAQFSKVRDEFVILKMPLESYRESTRSLPPGYYLAPSTLNTAQRRRERQLLELNFPASWRGVYSRRTPGWRPDTPVYVLKGEDLVGGLYLCAEHEFEEGSDWGQLHYFFVAEEEKGKGLHSILAAEAVRRARTWGLRGLFINTDRFGLPEVYQRWGATLWKVVPKANRPRGRHEFRGSDWLALTIHEEQLWRAIRRYARGELADIGCGNKPYARLTRGIVTRHISIDNEATDRHQIDGVATAYSTTLPDAGVDTVLCTDLLEHVERPGEAMREISRVLKPGGFAILSAPLLWHRHEDRPDFFRFTEDGLRYLIEESGLSVVQIRPLSGFIVTFAVELCHYLHGIAPRPARFVGAVQHLLQRVGYVVHSRGWDKSWRFTWRYIAIAAKVPQARAAP